MKTELRKKVEKFWITASDTWIFGMETCVFQCKFCPFHGDKIQVPDPDEVYSDFRNALEKIGPNRKHRFHLSDPVTNLKTKKYREYFRRLLELISTDENYDIENHGIAIYARINLMDDYYYDLLEEFSEKLKLQVFFGLENFDDRVLEDMNKGFRYEDIKNVFTKISNMKGSFLVSGSLIFGTPFDTEESFLLNMKRIKELKKILDDKNKINTFVANPLELMEHSKYYEEQHKYPDIFENNKLKKEWHDLAVYRATEFSFIAERGLSKMASRKIILDIDEDYFFLPVIGEKIIASQEERDRVYYKAPDQIDDIIKKFNMNSSKPHYKVFRDHDEVYFELKEMEFETKYKLVHIDAHSDIEYDTVLQDINLGNWITHLINEDIIENEIIWINQLQERPMRIEYKVKGKKYYLNISQLQHLQVPNNLSIDITFWTRSPEFCPTNNLEEEFRKKLPHLIKMN